MNRWKSILTMLIALWLPVQGYAAVVMPFCHHGLGTTKPADAKPSGHSHHHQGGHPGHIAHGDAHGGVPGTSLPGSADNGGANGLTCNNCGACQLACSPLIFAMWPNFAAIGDSVFEPAPANSPRFFFPEQLHRPPLHTQS